MIWLAAQSLRPGDVFMRQDRNAARVVSIRPNERVLKIKRLNWEVPTATGYAPTDNPSATSYAIDERDRFLIKIEIFERDQQFHPYGGEMNIHKDAIVLVIERGLE